MAPDSTDPADAASRAIERLLRRLEGKDLEGRLAALDQERRLAPGLIAELLALPEPGRALAAASSRFASPEVVWQLLDLSRNEPPPEALRHLSLARKIAIHLAALRPEAALHIQLRVEVSCEVAHRLLDGGDAAPATAPLREAAAELRPDLGYGRAIYCRALARLRRAEHRWEEALALGERAVRLLDEHGSAAETAAAEVEHGWLLLDSGDADEAVPVFERALPRVEPIPYPAVTCRLGLALALLDSGQGEDRSRIDRLLAEAEWMIGQASASGDLPRLRRLAAEALVRYRLATG
jgi:tetratricopeptide (TPR) repeat protein